MEVVKIADIPETAFTQANTTNSSFNSNDFQAYVDGTKKIGKKMQNKLKKIAGTGENTRATSA